jgi:hypothetical protein
VAVEVGVRVTVVAAVVVEKEEEEAAEGMVAVAVVVEGRAPKRRELFFSLPSIHPFFRSRVRVKHPFLKCVALLYQRKSLRDAKSVFCEERFFFFRFHPSLTPPPPTLSLPPSLSARTPPPRISFPTAPLPIHSLPCFSSTQKTRRKRGEKLKKSSFFTHSLTR